MPNEPVGAYVSSITFNNGVRFDVKPDDIVVFVGPNNAGKSRSLHDICLLAASQESTVVISHIEVTKYPGKLSSLLNDSSVGVRIRNNTQYNYLNWRGQLNEQTDIYFRGRKDYGGCRELFMANLNTSTRLITCSPADNINRTAQKQTPIHIAAFDTEHRKWLSKNFQKAFGYELIPNIHFGAKIPLCIGESVKALEGDFEDEQERQEAYAEILAKYKQVQDQGDGVKSFTSILLYLMLKNYCTYLIDEPESFLHPPQARIMGQILGQSLSDHQQAFIATHSEEIIKGLLETCPQRVKIVRITRHDDINEFSILKNEDLETVWKDSLLRYSNIMSSLFYKNVILCESDSDCKLYSIIEGHIRETEGRYSETLFIHCGGKHRAAKVVNALRSLNISIKLILDIDVLNDEGVFKGIIEAVGENWENYVRDYKQFSSNIIGSQKQIRKNEIQTLLQSFGGEILSDDDIKKVSNAIRRPSKWNELKDMGTAAIPKGDAMKAFENMNVALKKAGVYLVPVGELEGFISVVGGHGPEWVNRVLEEYPNLDAAQYDDICKFVKEVCSS